MKFSSILFGFVLLLCPAIYAADEVEAKANKILQDALEDKNPDIRKQAAVALSITGGREPYLTKLIGLLQDKDVDVRLAAIASLSEIRSKAVSAALRKALEDDVPEVSFAAAKALWSLGDPWGKKALMAVLEGENKTSSSFFSKQKRDALRMMHTPRTALLFAARQGVGFAPVPGLSIGISSMQAILTDPSVSGRATAALLLGQQNDPATLSALKEALHEKDATLRAAAVHALAMKNNPALKKDITPMLDDDKESVRLRAAAAYLKLSSIRTTRARAKTPAPVR